MSTRPPNILWLMSDEHRFDVAGYQGNPVVRTPTLDWLASTGVVFRNAYTPAPTCIPARQAMMAGQLPRTCGVEQWGTDLTPGYMTFARRFTQHAYATIACGHMHHLGPDQMQGWLTRIGADVGVGLHYVEDCDQDAFRLWYQPPPMWKIKKEIARAGVVGTQGWRQRLDAYTVAGALYHIHNYFSDHEYDRATPDRPTLLKVGVTEPHYPYQTDQARFRYYLNRVKPFINQSSFDHPLLSHRQLKVGVEVSEREVRRATAAYYGMVESMDAHFAQVIEALEQNGQDLDEWIIVYCSDHGEMLGEHGEWTKTHFFEASVKVPLIIRWPVKFRHRVVGENVNLCDLFATLCDLAGISLPSLEKTGRGQGLDSRSLVPLMAGDCSQWHSGYANETISQYGDDNLMIKRDALKYMWYGGYERDDYREVVFDLEHDPSECVNLASDQGYSAAVKEFRRRRRELAFGPDPDPNYQNAGYTRV